MAEVLVVGKKISEMDLVADIVGDEKIPTGVVGDKAVTTGQLVDYLNSNGRSAWGRIDGNISDQSDLQNELVLRDNALRQHLLEKDNPHNVTAAQIGLGNVDNTSDLDKPISTQTQQAINVAVSDKVTQSQLDEVIENKADKSTTLSGYNITDAYTKSEVDELPKSANLVLDDRGATQQEINNLVGAPWYNKSGGFLLGAKVSLQNGMLVQSLINGNTTDPNENMSGWEYIYKGQTPNEVKINSIKSVSHIGSLLESLSEGILGSVYVVRNSDLQFEVFTPFTSQGRYLCWRFDRDEGQFGAAPTDIDRSFVRPYLQTTVTDVYLEDRVDIPFSGLTVSGTTAATGTHTYLSQVGDSVTISGIRTKRLRLNYFSATNSGKVRITINGGSLLVNLVNKDLNDDAIFDMYSTDNSSKQIFIADDLPDIDLTIKVEVIGKNESSTENRLYLSTSAAISTYKGFSGLGTPTRSNKNVLKLGGSAVDYAILFSTEDDSENPAWGGSVHGWENLAGSAFYLDSKKYMPKDLPIGAYVACNNFQLVQSTEVYHYQRTDTPSAEVNILWNINRRGLQQGYQWVWKNPVVVMNGYTQMWTVYGGNSGGVGGSKTGWCDRVLFGNGQGYDLSSGASGEFGKVLANEVLFYGSQQTPTETNRNTDSGDTACLVTLPSVTRSFRDFENPVSVGDGIWIQDRPTFKKMYAQVYRSAGSFGDGDSHKSTMKVEFFKHPNLNRLIG